MSPWTLAGVAIGLSVAAQFLLKSGMQSSAVAVALDGDSRLEAMLAVAGHPMILAGLAAYGTGAVLWLGVLARMDVSKAYPLVGLGFVLTAIVGWHLGEQVSTTRLLGIALICSGVALVGRS